MDLAAAERDENVRLIRESAAGLAPRTGDLRRVRGLRFASPGFDRAVWRQMCEMGWPGLLVAEADGGAGLGMRALCALAEELGAALAPEPLISAVLAARLLRGDALAAQLDGTRLALPAWQERANRFDVGTATRVVDGRVSGRKLFIPAAGGADDFLVATVDGAVLVARDAAGVTLVKRLSGSDPMRAALLLTQSARVLGRLPGHGTSRAQLAAEVLGDSHGLDNGRPVATLVLRTSTDHASIDVVEAAGLQDANESNRERWARLGITVNELALPALCLNLPLDSSPVGWPPGEPVHLSLRRLLRRSPDWQVAQRDVFVCENPNIVAIAADRLGATCAPLVCTDGMPSAAQQTLLTQLADNGATLHYHGDFDWPGLTIGNFVMREFNAKPWRFGTADYLSAAADHAIALRGDKPVVARWDDRLAEAMSQRCVVVHEEGIVATLLQDLAENGATFGKFTAS